MKMKFFDLAKKMSLKSNHPEYKIGGCLVKKNKIVSLGFNQCKTHSKSNHPFKNVHCELDCILGISPEILMDSTIYLYRENKSGVVAMSKPCQWCNRLLRGVGVKTVFYTDYGVFKKECL